MAELYWSARGPAKTAIPETRRFNMLPLPVRLKLSVKLLRSIAARRGASGDQSIGSAAERDILAANSRNWRLSG